MQGRMSNERFKYLSDKTAISSATSREFRGRIYPTIAITQSHRQVPSLAVSVLLLPRAGKKMLYSKQMTTYR